MGNAINRRTAPAPAAPQPTQALEQKPPQRLSFSQIINTGKFQKAILNTLGSEKDAKEFTALTITTYNKTPAIQTCTAESVIGAALNGSVLKLPPSPQLGLFYMVPFHQKEKRDRAGNIIRPECDKAEFVLGWRGYWQLALRSEMYRKIIIQEIKEGEFRGWNPLLEELDSQIITDPYKRKQAPTIGYYGMFLLKNGFMKSLYMTREEMIDYADTFSPAFSKRTYNKIQNGEIPQDELWKYSSFWYKDFDVMGNKTIVRRLIGHYGPISVETEDVQKAFLTDNQIISLSDSGDIIMEDEPEFVDEPAAPSYRSSDITEPEFSEVSNQINLDDL